ncbi:MMPL family transporter [Nocardioides ferulae]|uniref:MMPL family transporter n=1 Tax=Nocardioides ferulae TaxID=2340821 RepID=UPI000EB062CE|nr:MMPL family transporter [Nocardioides ferulae]
MSSFLYRLGRVAAHRARLVVACWLAALLALGVAAIGLGGQLQQNLTIPGTESQEGIDLLDQRFPVLAGTSGQLLFVAPDGQRITEHRDQVREVLRRVEDVEHVRLVVDPFADGYAHALSEDGRHALSQVQLDVKLDELDPDTVAALEDAAQLPEGSALEVHLGGSIFTTTEVTVSATEAVGVGLALIVLAVTFGSLLAAGMPILTALLGVAVTMAGVLAAASVATITSTTPTLALMIGLAVGIDYALFIVFRHRTQLASGMDVAESVARSVATAGSAVIFAGATVVIALCGLVVARIPFLSVMGFAAAAGVAVAVAVAVSFVPALLALAGERLRPRPSSRAARHALASPDDGHTMGARWVAAVTRLPALTLVLVTAALLVMALPAKDLQLGLPDNGTKEPGSTPRVTYDLVSDAYGPGYNSPLLVTTDIIRTTDPVGVMERLGQDLAALDRVAAVPLATPNPDADLGIVQVVPETGQTDPATADLVRQIRELRPELEARYDVTDLKVTGQTAVTIDVSDRLSGALLPFGVVVVGLSLLLLTIVFRSVAVPLKATLGYLLSVLASFGAVAAVFEWGWLAETLNVARVGPVISFLPIILMGVLFGLAMDYEVFLVSRMSEEFVHTGDATRAVTAGFAASARVVTAAAVIMICVFAAFVPHGDSIVKPIALGLAVGVFVDAFLVRMTLVPAVMALLGHRAWWLPARLDRRLPHLDVEGAGLQAHLDHEDWVRRHGEAAVRAEEVLLVDEHGAPLLAPVSLVVHPGSLHVVSSDDRVARKALLAALAGRFDIAGGTLVVQGRLLPSEALAVRAQVWHFDRMPPLDRLRDLAERAGRGLLVVVDDVDLQGGPDAQAHRWTGLAELTAGGATVVAGARTAPPPGVPHRACVLAAADPADRSRPARTDSDREVLA